MANLLSTLINIYMLIVVVRVVMSWFDIESDHPVFRFMYDITEPVLSRIREVLPTFGGLDFSPVVLLLGLTLLQNILF